MACNDYMLGNLREHPYKREGLQKVTVKPGQMYQKIVVLRLPLDTNEYETVPSAHFRRSMLLHCGRSDAWR
jgi:hypothetical protein